MGASARVDGLNRKPHSWQRKTSLSREYFLSKRINLVELQRWQRKRNHLRIEMRDGPLFNGSVPDLIHAMLHASEVSTRAGQKRAPPLVLLAG